MKVTTMGIQSNCSIRKEGRGGGSRRRGTIVCCAASRVALVVPNIRILVKSNEWSVQADLNVVFRFGVP